MLLSLLLQASIVTAKIAPRSQPEWDMQNLIAFGDSYTDEGRLAYIQSHNKLPPAGQLLAPTNNTSVGGFVWARDVALQTGAMLYDYAVGAAMVSDNVTSHFSPNLNASYPSVLDYEIPAFRTDLGFKQLYPNRTSSNTVYTLWIGTNDFGIDGFLGDEQEPGATITSFVNAIFEAFDELYNLGGRQFVLLNTIPLDITPTYASIEHGGTGNSSYWGNKALFNTTKTESQIREITTSANTMLEFGLPFFSRVKRRWPSAQVALFDVHTLFLDVQSNPEIWFTEPHEVKKPWKGCDNGDCFQSSDPLTGYMWYDELHPSPTMSEIVAKEFVKVVMDRSAYGARY